MNKNVLLAIGLLTVVVLISVNAQNFSEPVRGGGYKVGSKVTDFSLKNVDGKMVAMADYKDAKGFIVVFTCNSCPYAKMYEQRIEQLNQKYVSKGFPVLAINPNDASQKPDDDFNAMIARSSEKSYSFPYLYDESQEVASQFGATRTPHIYILEKRESDLNVVYIGAIDNNAKDASAVDRKYAEDALDALISGKKVKNDFTKAIGCTIKWKEA